jgi:hypothetical protein
MYTLLFFLPIYYLVIKQHSRIQTAIMLLPQTASILPCALLVEVLIKRRVTARRILLLGWVCTSCGVGLLTLLNAERSISSDVLLNLLSGIGVSTILSALHTAGKEITTSGGGVQSQTFLISLRYLGSTLGLVAVGNIFRCVLGRNLQSTKLSHVAGNMTQRATMMVYTIHALSDPVEVEILINATQISLRTIWMILAIACLAKVLICLVMATVASSLRQKCQGEVAPTQRSCASDPILCVAGVNSTNKN